MAKKSPKIYKVKTGKMKSSAAHNVLSTVIMVAAAGLVGFVGYSVAKPFIDDSAESSNEVQFNTATNGTGTEEDSSAATTTITITQIEQTTTITSGTGVLASEMTGTSTAETTIQTTNNVNTTTANSGAVTTATTAVVGGNSDPKSDAQTDADATATDFTAAECAVWLPESALDSEDVFTSALDQVKGSNADADAVVVPMKLQGGLLNYQSNISYVAGMNICTGSMTASEIVSIAREKGLLVYGSVSALNDCEFPNLRRDAGIQLSDGGGRWLDDDPEDGGKAWMSPYSGTAREYLTRIVSELDAAGFAAVICQDFVYPSFRESDREFIGSEYFDDTRNTALVSLANAMADAASSDMAVVLQVSADNAMNGITAVYDAKQLDVPYILLNTDSSSVSTVAEWAKQEQSAGLSAKIAFRFSSAVSGDIVQQLQAKGYENYMIPYNG